MQRLSGREVALLALETPHQPAHVITVGLFQARPDFDRDRLRALIRDRLAYVPRYRMRVRALPGGLGSPVWVEDEDFDLDDHVHLTALPRPGNRVQLNELVARLAARRLDRDRPLWEALLVEGVDGIDETDGGLVALVITSHLALVDGVDAVDLAQVLLDDDPDIEPVELEDWQPLAEPSPTSLLAGAVLGGLQDPERAVAGIRDSLTGVLGLALTAGEALGETGGGLSDLLGDLLGGGRATGGRPPVASPLGRAVGGRRRFATATVPLADVATVREPPETVDDVILAVLAGALRSWQRSRGGEPLRDLVAQAPVAVPDAADEPSALGLTAVPRAVELPVTEPDPLVRLRRLAEATGDVLSGDRLPVGALTGIAGFAPPTLHALGVRAVRRPQPRPYDLIIVNAPGPVTDRYAAGARLVASYPVLPLGAGRPLTIGVTSYAGQLSFGLTGDHDTLSDLEALAAAIPEAVTELRDARRPSTPPASRGRSGSRRRPRTGPKAEEPRS